MIMIKCQVFYFLRMQSTEVPIGRTCTNKTAVLIFEGQSRSHNPCSIFVMKRLIAE